MRNIIIGCTIGALVATLLVVLYGGLLNAAADRQLIEAWRKIQPGMPLADAKSELGEPSGQYPLGQGFPEWAQRSVPDDFSKSHGLLTYVIPVLTPQVLLIYYDSDERVVFVSSVPS
jgi:hypothetical protein